jgi:hypothetical protein
VAGRGKRIARARGRAHDRLRSIFLEGVCLKLFDRTQGPWTSPIATYTDSWYLDKHEYSDVVAGKKFKRLVVEDTEGCRLSKLRQMTAVQVGDTVYKFVSKDSFVGSVPSYEFKLQPTGERV